MIRLLLSPDPVKRQFRRFDRDPFPERGYGEKTTRAASPLGIAFEFAPGKWPADPVPPNFLTVGRWGRDPKSMVEAYFGGRP